MIYQHGVTTAKENAYAFAKNLTAVGLAVIAIDLPLHGERSLDSTRSANSDPLAYINLTYLAVARDNLRQSILDVLGLRAALTLSQPLFTGTRLSGINVGTGSKVRMLGHSLGNCRHFCDCGKQQDLRIYCCRCYVQLLWRGDSKLRRANF